MKFGEAIYEAPHKNSPVILTISYKTEGELKSTVISNFTGVAGGMLNVVI